MTMWAHTNQCSGPASTIRRRSGSTRPRRSTGRRHRPRPSTPGLPFYSWFPDGELNICANALDRHVEAGNGDRAALIYDSPVTGTKRTYTYAQLLDEVARFAGVLAGLGVGRGDRVVVYMPMVPEAAIAMLACARLGAVHSVVFGGFAPRELAIRIDDATPEGDRVRVLRHRGQAGAPVQAPAGRGDRAGRAHARQAGHPAASPGDGGDGPGRRRLGRGDGERRAGRARDRRGDGPALHPLHLRHHGEAQGRAARHRRLRGGNGLDDGQPLRHRTGRDDVHRVRRRLGRRALLHRVRAADRRRDDDHLRGQARRHPGRRPVLAGDRRARSESDVHRPHGLPGDQEGRPEGRAAGPVRPVAHALPVPRRRAPGPRDLPLGLGPARNPRHRPLVADGDGVGDLREPGGAGAPADQAGLAHEADARLGRAHRRQLRSPGAARRGRRDRHQAAAAARRAADPVERRRPLRAVVPARRSTAST